MVSYYENQSRFLEGTETVTIHTTDSADGVAVPYALCGELSYREAQQLGTVNVETPTIAIQLDKANLSDIVPRPGCKIIRADSTKWRIMSTPLFDALRGLYRCVCNQLK